MAFFSSRDWDGARTRVLLSSGWVELRQGMATV
ncbi:MAG: hypothetical protein [Siphoviridae sp. ct7UA22]|nr:MAG: hypothetical protein [Siphoviridae sp. ct7UA22]